MALDRRRVLTGSAAMAATLLALPARAQEPPSPAERAKMAEAAEAFHKEHDVPGFAVAFTRDGKLVHEAAFGLADRDANEALTPAHRFRIASISKPVTAVAIFTLIEAGHLKLGDRVLGPEGLLGETYGKIAAGSPMREITVDHLLTHTAGGWPNDGTDPMFRSGMPDHASLIETTLAYQPTRSAPGTYYAYSNFGYCLLGRVIERVGGKPYADYVKETLLAPIGVADMEIAGNTLAERQPSEVRYHDAGRSPYGLDVRRMDSHGGWIASAASLARFAAAADGRWSPRLLKPETIATMTTSDPLNPAYARGWRVNAHGNAWHTGSLPGTATIMVRTASGLTWAALCNTRARETELARDLDRLMWVMARAVPRWKA